MSGSFRHPPFRALDRRNFAAPWTPELVRGEGTCGGKLLPQRLPHPDHRHRDLARSLDPLDRQIPAGSVQRLSGQRRHHLRPRKPGLSRCGLANRQHQPPDTPPRKIRIGILPVSARRHAPDRATRHRATPCCDRRHRASPADSTRHIRPADRSPRPADTSRPRSTAYRAPSPRGSPRPVPE